jgi:hypothetical protein
MAGRGATEVPADAEAEAARVEPAEQVATAVNPVSPANPVNPANRVDDRRIHQDRAVAWVRLHFPIAKDRILRRRQTPRPGCARHVVAHEKNWVGW